jgi:uncharacterized LabA/DUF88 family protein
MANATTAEINNWNVENACPFEFKSYHLFFNGRLGYKKVAQGVNPQRAKIWPAFENSTLLKIVIASSGLLRQIRAFMVINAALMKAYLFVDGSNFCHGLKQNRMYGDFSYESFFEALSEKFAIMKSYYYDAVKNIEIEPDQYSRQQRFHARLSKGIPNVVIQTRKLKYLNLNHRVEKEKENTGFCEDCCPKVDTFLSKAGLKKLSREKGIDTVLVTDMIKGEFQDRYDIAIIATGDADFVPAVELVKSLKKQVVNVHFYAGSAYELRKDSDSHLLIQMDAQKKCCFK